jgi:GNAT superfamily N-acetyltransferase
MLAELLNLRKARVDDATQMSELFRITYGESSHPCKDPRHIRDTIQNGSCVWRLAADASRVVACSSLIINDWNRSWELGRGVTLPEYRGEGIATTLQQQALDEACASPRCELMLGVPRNRTMLKIARDLRPAFHPVGHDGAINIANAVREYHTIAFAAKPNAGFRHYIPRFRTLADHEFVAANVFQPLGYCPERGEYPDVWVAGNASGYRGLGSFSFEYDPSCVSNSLELTGCDITYSDARQAADSLLLILEGLPDVLHVRLAVPIDKIEFIAHLTDAGFEITAYLPAWFRVGRGRYDCVLLVRHAFQDEPVDHGVRDVVDQFRSGLNGERGAAA